MNYFKVCVLFLFIIFGCKKTETNYNLSYRCEQNVSFNTKNGHIEFVGSVNDIETTLVIDNGCAKTIIDSSFFESFINKSQYKLKDFEPLLNLFTYEGKILIKIKGKSYSVKNFEVRNLKEISAFSCKAIIGYDILQSQIFTLDFVNQYSMLTNDYPDTSGYQKINLTQSDKFKHLKFINAKIFANLNKAKTGKFIFDLYPSEQIHVKNYWVRVSQDY